MFTSIPVMTPILHHIISMANRYIDCSRYTVSPNMNEERHLDINQARLIGRCSWFPEWTLADGDTKASNNPMLSTQRNTNTEISMAAQNS